MSTRSLPTVAAGRHRDEPLKGILIMLLAMAVFTTQDTVSKLLTDDYPVIQIAWGRYLFHTLFMLPLIIGRAGLARLRTTHPWLQVIRGLGMLSSSVLFILALGSLPIAEASAIGFISPMFVAALSIVFLGERVGFQRWLAVLVGFAGVLVVIRPGTAAFEPAALLPVAAAVGWAVALTASRKIRTDDAPVTTLIHTAVSGLVVLSLAVPFFWTPLDPAGWLLMAVQGLLAAAAQYALIAAFAMASASLLAPFSYSQMVWATLAGMVVFGTMPDGWTWVGAFIIIGCGLAMWHDERRQDAGAKRLAQPA